jgi:hypothetical protein
MGLADHVNLSAAETNTLSHRYASSLLVAVKRPTGDPKCARHALNVGRDTSTFETKRPRKTRHRQTWTMSC